MTVAELIAELQGLNPDANVFVYDNFGRTYLVDVITHGDDVAIEPGTY